MQENQVRPYEDYVCPILEPAEAHREKGTADTNIICADCVSAS